MSPRAGEPTMYPCRCGKVCLTAQQRGQLCTTCWGREVAAAVNGAIVLARSGRQVRVTISTPNGTHVFLRPARAGGRRE